MWGSSHLIGRLSTFLLASSTTTTTKNHGDATSRPPNWPPETPLDVVETFRQIYQDLEAPGPVSVQVTPTLRFSYVTPPLANGTSTWRQSARAAAATSTVAAAENKPVAVYLPGLDGYGVSCIKELDNLARTFELWRLSIPTNDRSSFVAVVTAFCDFIQDRFAKKKSRPVTLIGESTGGVLASAVAWKLLKTQPPALQGLVLVNPATSFEQSPWDVLIPIFTSLPHNGTSEDVTPYSVLGSLLLSAVLPDADQWRRILELMVNLPELDVPPSSLNQWQQVWNATTTGFGATAARLTPGVLEHRVKKWLQVATPLVNTRLSSLQNLPTLVVVGQDDRLLPSSAEVKRLTKVIPHCETLTVRGRGHLVLDDNVNLTEAILYSKIDPLHWNKDEKKSCRPRYDPITDWKLAESGVRKELETSIAQARTLYSPIFFSTDSVTGKRWRGLSKLPTTTNGRPLLFVGNHQFAALDLGILLAELYEQRGLFPRGLAHPINFNSRKPPELLGRTPGLLVESGKFGGDFFQKFGAVKVTPRNYFRLLQSGQDVLLFPGGAKEALTPNRRYPLYWPSKLDFVRTAARFNATIIPFSAIGMVESVNVLAQLEQVEQRIAPFIRRRSNNTNNEDEFSRMLQSARFDGQDQPVGFPLALPTLPARNYFLFGKPISLEAVDSKDKEACLQAYEQTQLAVRTGIDDLLRARKHDAYDRPPRRLLYERLWG